MESDIRRLVVMVIGAAIAIPILFYAVDIVLPPEDVPVPEEQQPQVDTAVTAQSLAYLTQKTEVAKVVVKGLQVFIGFNTKPNQEDLAAIVNEAALKYASATGRAIYVHGTHMEQMASIGTPSFHEYCSTHARIDSVLGDDGKAVDKPVKLESTC